MKSQSSLTCGPRTRSTTPLWLVVGRLIGRIGGAGEKVGKMTPNAISQLFESSTGSIDAPTKKTSYFPKINRLEEEVGESVLYFDRYRRIFTDIEFNAVDSVGSSSHYKDFIMYVSVCIHVHVFASKKLCHSIWRGIVQLIISSINSVIPACHT